MRRVTPVRRTAVYDHDHYPTRAPKGPTGGDGLPLFGAFPAGGPQPLPDVVGELSRANDAATSRTTADAIHGKLSELQVRVLEAIRQHGPIDAAALEDLPRFASLAPSTVRKRVTELVRAGRVVEYDVKKRPGRGSISRWVVAGGPDHG